MAETLLILALVFGLLSLGISFAVFTLVWFTGQSIDRSLKRKKK